MNAHTHRLRGRDVLKQMPEDGLALNIHLTCWALSPRALVMAIGVPYSALHSDSRGKSYLSPGSYIAWTWTITFYSITRILVEESKRRPGSYGMDVEILEFPG